jgi:hypothetical protein
MYRAAVDLFQTPVAFFLTTVAGNQLSATLTRIGGESNDALIDGLV